MPGGMFVGGIPGQMPFQIVNPQNPQMSSLGMFPMMQGLQVPGMGMQNPTNKYFLYIIEGIQIQIKIKLLVLCR